MLRALCKERLITTMMMMMMITLIRIDQVKQVRFEVLTATNMKMAIFWVVGSLFRSHYPDDEGSKLL
jgi:hypothetical protein